MEFKNKKITVMGLGTLGGGVGTALFFAKRGAKVTVTDLKSEKELEKSIARLKNYTISYILGRHRDEDFVCADLIIKNPAVSSGSHYIKLAGSHNVPIEMAESLFMKLSPTKDIIGVTGTRGKSTTCALIYEVLKQAGKDVYIGGNVKGVSTLSLLDNVTDSSIVVLELSSWQLESFGWHIT